MKNSLKCTKCGSDDLARIVGPVATFMEGGANCIPIGGGLRIPVTRYLCISCGYSEEWVECSSLELRQLKRYSSKER